MATAQKAIFKPRSEGSVQTFPLPPDYTIELSVGPEMTSQPNAKNQIFKFYRAFIRHPLPPVADAPPGAPPVYERVQFVTPANVHISILPDVDRDYRYKASMWFWAHGEQAEPGHHAWIEGAEQFGQQLRDMVVAVAKQVKMAKDASLQKVTIVRPNLDEYKEPKPGASPFVNAVVELPATKTTSDGKTITTPGSIFVDAEGNNIPATSVLGKRIRGTAIIEAEQIFVGTEQRSLILKIVEVQVLQIRERTAPVPTVTSRFRPVSALLSPDGTPGSALPVTDLIGPPVKRPRNASDANSVPLVHDEVPHGELPLDGDDKESE